MIQNFDYGCQLSFKVIVEQVVSGWSRCHFCLSALSERGKNSGLLGLLHEVKMFRNLSVACIALSPMRVNWGFH